MIIYKLLSHEKSIINGHFNGGKSTINGKLLLFQVKMRTSVGKCCFFSVLHPSHSPSVVAAAANAP